MAKFKSNSVAPMSFSDLDKEDDQKSNSTQENDLALSQAQAKVNGTAGSEVKANGGVHKGEGLVKANGKETPLGNGKNQQQTIIPPVGPVNRKLSREGTGNSSPGRKSAWERAEERFQEQERAMVEHKKSQPVEFVSSSLNDEDELSLQDIGCCNVKAIKRVFRSRKFRNPKLEQLYQRYFFKLNQNNLTWLMALVAALCILLLSFHYAGGSLSIMKGIVLGIILLGLFILEIISNQSNFNHLQLFIVSYIVIGLLIIIVIVVTMDTSPQTASEGVWCTIFCIYMVHTLLPVRMRLSVIAGLVLTLTHIVCAATINSGDSFLWKQVC